MKKSPKSKVQSPRSGKTQGALSRTVRDSVLGTTAAVVEPEADDPIEQLRKANRELGGDDPLEVSVFDQCCVKAIEQRISVHQAIKNLYGPLPQTAKLHARLAAVHALAHPLDLEELESKIQNPKSKIDAEVADFRESFDTNRIVEDLGHTPNAMAGAIVDSARSDHEANGRKKTGKPTNGFVVELPAAEQLRASNEVAFDIPIGLIDPTPDNARKTFDEAELKSLAESLKTGQETPCKVRRQPRGRFQLFDGERRFRAAKIARIKTLRCEVADITDEEARKRGLIINLQRKDLNPIERGIGYKQLLDDGMTQQGVSDLFGLSGQAAVSNAVRLLELPDEIKSRVQSGQIEQTVAVNLVPWMRREGMAKAFVEMAKAKQWQIDVRQLKHELAAAAHKCAFRLPEFPSERLDFAKKHKAAIDLVELGYCWFIFNKPEWNRLWGEHNKKQKAKEGKKTPSREDKVASSNARYERERKRREYEDAVAATVLAWLGPKVVAWLRTQPAGSPFCAKYLTARALNDGFMGSGDLVKAAKTLGLPVKWKRDHRASDFGRLGELTEAQLGAVMRRLIEEDIEGIVNQAGGGWGASDDAREMAIVAADAGIQWEKEWTVTRDFLELHDVDGLKDLAKEWSVKLPEGKELTKASAMETLLGLAENRRLPVPEIVRKVLKGFNDPLRVQEKGLNVMAIGFDKGETPQESFAKGAASLVLDVAGIDPQNESKMKSANRQKSSDQ